MKRAAAVIVCLAWGITAHAEKAEIGGPILHGYEPQFDLPPSLRVKNVGGTDGAGLCVFTSIQYAAWGQNVEELRDFRDKMTHEKGGGWPEKVDEMMKKYAPGVRYLQYQGSDSSIVKLALKTSRLPCVTLSWSERYHGKVAHMVNCPFLDQGYGEFLDNNFIADNELEGMSETEWVRRWSMGGGGWVIVLLDVGAPPVPFKPVVGESPVAIQWGGGGCGPVGPLSFEQPSYHWEPIAGHDDQLMLMHGARQVGNLDKASLKYYRFNGLTWDAAPSSPPIVIPESLRKLEMKPADVDRRGCHCTRGCKCKSGECHCKDKDRCVEGCKCNAGLAGELADEDGNPCCGVNRDKLPKLESGEELWTLNGKPCRRMQALMELAANDKLDDDSAKGWLVCVDQGGKFGKQLQADLTKGGELAELAKNWRVATYSDPQNLMLKDRKGVPLYPDWQGMMTLTPDGVPLYQINGTYSTDKALALLRLSKGMDPKQVADASVTPAKPDTPADPASGNETPLWVHSCCAASLVALAFFLYSKVALYWRNQP